MSKTTQTAGPCVARIVLTKIALGVTLGALSSCSSDPKPEQPIGRELAKLTPSKGTFDALVPAKEHYLYAGTEDIHVIDVKNGSDAVEVSVFPGAAPIAVRGDVLYYYDTSDRSLNVADISAPAEIKPIARLTDPDISLEMLRTIGEAPNQMVVASRTIGPEDEVLLFDMLHPERPEQVARFRTGYGKITGLTIDHDTLYVGHDTPPTGTIQVWDVHDWDHPVELGRAVGGRCSALYVATKGVVYCAYGASEDPLIHGTPILDARDPAHPTFPSSVVSETTWRDARSFVSFGHYLVVRDVIPANYQNKNPEASKAPTELLEVFETSDPVHPKGLETRFDSPSAVAVDARFLYLAKGSLSIIARGDR